MIRLLAGVLPLLLLMSCGSTPVSKVPAVQAVVQVPAGELLPLALRGPVALTLRIREAGAADQEVLKALQHEDEKLTSTMLVTSGYGLWDALTWGGVGAGAEVLGAIIVLPTVLALNVVNAKSRDAINRALRDAELGKQIRTHLEALAPASDSLQSGLAAQLSVLVSYGVVPKDNPDTGVLCLVTRAILMVDVDGRTAFQDVVHIEPYLRSSDSPPPLCGSLDTLAARDAHAVRNALVDYAQVLAAIIVRRTEALPWHVQQQSH